MPTAKLHALTILGALDEARSELVGKAVVLTDGKAGTVENVWLDELHGLRISIRGHDGKWPVSTINSRRPAETAKAERLSRTGCASDRRLRHQRSRAREMAELYPSISKHSTPVAHGREIDQQPRASASEF